MAVKEIPENLRTRVEQWFQETIRFGAIAQDTQAYNQAVAAKNKLYDVLADYLGAPAVEDDPPPALPSESLAKASTIRSEGD